MWGVHGCLGGLSVGRSCEHCLLGGLAIRFVWGLGGTVLRFLDPKKLLGTESVMGAAPMELPVPN